MKQDGCRLPLQRSLMVWRVPRIRSQRMRWVRLASPLCLEFAPPPVSPRRCRGHGAASKWPRRVAALPPRLLHHRAPRSYKDPRFSETQVRMMSPLSSVPRRTFHPAKSVHFLPHTPRCIARPKRSTLSFIHFSQFGALRRTNACCSSPMVWKSRCLSQPTLTQVETAEVDRLQPSLVRITNHH